MSAQQPAKGPVSDSELVRVQPTSNDADRRPERRVAVLDVPAPCKLLNSNQRPHRMEKAKLVKAWRKAGEQAGEGIAQFDGLVHITAHIWKPRGGRWDPNNYWDTVKPLVDGIVDAGVLKDDDWENVIGPDHRRGGKGEPRVVLTIELIQ